MKGHRPPSVAPAVAPPAEETTRLRDPSGLAQHQKLQYRTNVVKNGMVKLKVAVDASRPEFFLTDGFRFKEVFAVLSRTEKHAENQWVLHRCELFFYQRAEDHDIGNDPLVSSAPSFPALIQ